MKTTVTVCQDPRGPKTTEPLDLGRRLIDDLDNVAELLAIAEGDDHR